MSESDSETDHERFQRLLRQGREAAKLRQSDVAKRLNQPQSYVSKYESGERRLDFLELRAVLDILGISLEEFVRRFEAPDAG